MSEQLDDRPWYFKVIQPFYTHADRDEWPDPPDGAICSTLDDYNVWQRRGGTWVLLAPSSAAGTSSYIHYQGVPAATWVIDHPLAFDPNVTVIDSSGAQVEGDVVFQSGRVTVTFSAAFAGTAYLS